MPVERLKGGSLKMESSSDEVLQLGNFSGAFGF
jgi:hypothetical protein